MMLDNSIISDTVEITTNNMLDLVRYFFLGKYTYREYEYTFYLDGEELKADDCFSNSFGRSYCELNGVTYNNVEYTKVLVNEYEKFDTIMPVFSFGILLLLIVEVIMKLFYTNITCKF